MISPLTNTADVTAHAIRLVEADAVRDVRDIFVHQAQIVTVSPLRVQVTPDFSYEQLQWPEVVDDTMAPALSSLLGWLGQ